MQEVEAIASRVLIIHKGEIQYDGQLGGQIGDTETIEVQFSETGFDTQTVQNVAGVQTIEFSGTQLLVNLSPTHALAFRQVLVAESVRQAKPIVHMASKQNNLEALFRKFTT
jgi:ABC-type multidrug transport system ATPase subunit